MLAKGAFVDLKKRIEPERYGGAPLLGLRGNLIKAHGSANRQALKNAIHDASEMIKLDLNHRIEADIALANDAIRHAVA
jgi:glycerol-3-phosphate acyltransferase PlsX